MLQSGEILVSDQLNNDELEFIINQSFELFCKLRNYNNLSLNNVFFLKEQLRKMYLESTNNLKIYTVKINEKIVGCACLLMDIGYIRDLFVKEENQRQGIGTLILKRVIEDMTSIKDITITTHPSIVDFYKKNDFLVVLANEHNITMKKSKYRKR